MYVRCLQCNLDLVTLREKNVMKLENVTEYVFWFFLLLYGSYEYVDFFLNHKMISLKICRDYKL